MEWSSRTGKKDRDLIQMLDLDETTDELAIQDKTHWLRRQLCHILRIAIDGQGKKGRLRWTWRK